MKESQSYYSTSIRWSDQWMLRMTFIRMSSNEVVISRDHVTTLKWMSNKSNPYATHWRSNHRWTIVGVFILENGIGMETKIKTNNRVDERGNRSQKLSVPFYRRERQLNSNKDDFVKTQVESINIRSFKFILFLGSFHCNLYKLIAFFSVFKP